MYRYAATLVAHWLSCAIAPCVSLGAESPADKLVAEQSARKTVDDLTGQETHQPYWKCETTQASGLHLWEYDTFDKIGDLWVHGAARPVRGAKEPFYDLYLGYDYVHSHWVYIQIAPAIGTYFVALSDGATLDGTWRIVYPWELGGYTVRTPGYNVRTALNFSGDPVPGPSTNLRKAATRSPCEPGREPNANADANANVVGIDV